MGEIVKFSKYPGFPDEMTIGEARKKLVAELPSVEDVTLHLKDGTQASDTMTLGELRAHFKD